MANVQGHTHIYAYILMCSYICVDIYIYMYVYIRLHLCDTFGSSLVACGLVLWCYLCAMLPRRRWKDLCPPSPFGVRFGDVKRLFNARPSISAFELRDLCASDFHMDVPVGAIEHWLWCTRMDNTIGLAEYDDWLKGVYNICRNVGSDYYCGLLSDAGVHCPIFIMDCWLSLQGELPMVQLKDFRFFLGPCELDGYSGFLHGCCYAMPGISPQRLRTAVMQSMGEKCRLQQMVNWMLSHGYLKPRRATAKAKAAMAKGKAQARRRWATTITPGRIVSS